MDDSPILGFYDIFYWVADMPRALAFYRDQLGLRVVYESAHWTSLAMPGFGPVERPYLGLHWTGGDPVPGASAGENANAQGATITLEVSQIEAAVAILKARGVAFLGDIRKDPWGSQIALRDPDGNLLKLFQAPSSTDSYTE